MTRVLNTQLQTYFMMSSLVILSRSHRKAAILLSLPGASTTETHAHKTKFSTSSIIIMITNNIILSVSWEVVQLHCRPVWQFTLHMNLLVTQRAWSVWFPGLWTDVIINTLTHLLSFHLPLNLLHNPYHLGNLTKLSSLYFQWIKSSHYFGMHLLVHFKLT